MNVFLSSFKNIPYIDLNKLSCSVYTLLFIKYSTVVKNILHIFHIQFYKNLACCMLLSILDPILQFMQKLKMFKLRIFA